MSKDHTGFPGGILDIESLRQRASAATVAKPSDKLDAPAQVGNTVFRKGVEARLVVEAAQRNYQRTHNPTEEDKRIAAGVESIAQLRKKIEAEHDAKSPFRREVEKLGQRECRHCGWLCMPNDAPAKTFYPLEPQAAQQHAEPSHADSFASKAVYATAIADAQQAEPESVIKRQAQKIGELIADRDSWIEAHARLYRLYHDQSPKAGEEIHVNVEGGDVYTLPLQLSGMDKPRFVVHVPRPQQAEPHPSQAHPTFQTVSLPNGPGTPSAQTFDRRIACKAGKPEWKSCAQQAEPGADERVKRDAERFADAFADGWVPLLPEDTNRTAELLRILAAQSGQRAGVTEDAIEAAAKKLAEDFDYPWEHMPAQGKDDFRAKVRSIAAMLAAPTQQQERSE